MKLTVLTIMLLMGANSTFSQEYYGQSAALKNIIDVNITKTGPYLGVQRGKYTIIEIGGERQWKRVRFKAPKTHAAHMGFNYNIKYNVLGYDVGYWLKPNRIGLTYGGTIFYRTDFISSRLGFAPVLGFKFMWFHLQTGYHFMSRLKSVFETNTFFVSLRVGIINDRDIDIKRKKFKFEK